MISTALCFTLLLSSTFAKQVTVDQLLDEISSEVAADMTRFAKAGKGLRPLELNTHLLNTLRNDLNRLAPRVHKLFRISGASVDYLAKNLAIQIKQDSALRAALSANRQNNPRFLGALTLGITQVVTDGVKMILTRY